MWRGQRQGDQVARCCTEKTETVSEMHIQSPVSTVYCGLRATTCCSESIYCRYIRRTVQPSVCPWWPCTLYTPLKWKVSWSCSPQKTEPGVSVGRTKLINETVAREWTRRDCLHYSYQCVFVYLCMFAAGANRAQVPAVQTELLMGEDGKDDKVQAGNERKNI